MLSVRRPLVLLCCCVAVLTVTACAGGSAATTVAPQTQRKVVNVAKPAASPIVMNASSGRRDASPVPAPNAGLHASALGRLSDGRQVVVVDSTDGEGVWVRRQPAGEPIRVWPDGSPMLVIGDDTSEGGRTWRNVTTLDGQTGWVAADFVTTVDRAELAALMPNLGELVNMLATPGTAPAGLQARVDQIEATPTPGLRAPVAPATAPSATGQTVAQASMLLPFMNQPIPPPTAQTRPAGPTSSSAPASSAATPKPTSMSAPTATPVKAPSGATSIEAGPTTMMLTAVEKAPGLKIGARPRTDMEMLSVQVKVTNQGDAPFALYRGAFRLALSDRSRLDPLAGGVGPLPYSAEVAPGATLEGSLVFEVPTGTRVDGLIWAPDRDVAYLLTVPS